MKKVDGSAVRLVDATDEMLAGVLPESLAVTLGGIAQACRDGLMAVAVEAGLATALAIMKEEADALCGAWNARHADRDHERGGTTATSVVMGGQRLPIRRPRVHAVEGGRRGGEVPLATYGIFAQARSTSKSAVSRRFVAGTKRALGEEEPVEQIFERVAGLDVHRDSVSACA